MKEQFTLHERCLKITLLSYLEGWGRWEVGAPSRAYGPGPKTRGSCLSSQIRSGHVLIYVKNRHPSASLCTCFQGNCPPSSCVSGVPARGRELGVSNVSACAVSCPVVFLNPLLCRGAGKRSRAGASGNAPGIGKRSWAGASGNTSHSTDLDLTSCTW